MGRSRKSCGEKTSQRKLLKGIGKRKTEGSKEKDQEGSPKGKSEYRLKRNQTCNRPLPGTPKTTEDTKTRWAGATQESEDALVNCTKTLGGKRWP